MMRSKRIVRASRRAGLVPILAFALLQSCAGPPASLSSRPSPTSGELLRVVASQRGEDPLIGIWNGTATGYSWSVAVIKEENPSTGYTLKGVMVQPWPFFSEGEEVLHLKPSSVAGVYEGTQKWKNALRVTWWFPARALLEGNNLFTQFNSVNIPTGIATTWVYLRADAPAQQAPRRGGREGSGFVLRGSRLVLTSYHVVEGAKEVRVVFKGDEYVAKLFRRDERNDLALLSVD